jgi:dipeptidyl aminopeptidase/acylaminoacyl peptidase
MKTFKFFLFFLLLLGGVVGGFLLFQKFSTPNVSSIVQSLSEVSHTSVADQILQSLSIEALRKGEFTGSDIVTEQTLESGNNYNRYLVSYKSEGLKIYALLTIPKSKKPEAGYPIIVFNHGYIPPAEYKTTERYVAYVDSFARNGYVVIKPDYRGHGSSEGIATGGYGSNSYTIDVLNALASVKKLPNVNPEKIGMWGHSMGGYITLRSMVVSKDVKVGVIWGGVVASYPDLLTSWRRRTTPSPVPAEGASASSARSWRRLLTEQFGDPMSNPSFWNSISANSYLSDISGPIQLHHAEGDEEVPVEFSRKLSEQLQSAGKEVELYTYPGDNHNISGHFGIAMQRSVEFFDRYLK